MDGRDSFNFNYSAFESRTFLVFFTPLAVINDRNFQSLSYNTNATTPVYSLCINVRVPKIARYFPPTAAAYPRDGAKYVGLIDNSVVSFNVQTKCIIIRIRFAFDYHRVGAIGACVIRAVRLSGWTKDSEKY